jgi:hypothetical protein
MVSEEDRLTRGDSEDSEIVDKLLLARIVSEEDRLTRVDSEGIRLWMSYHWREWCFKINCYMVSELGDSAMTY